MNRDEAHEDQMNVKLTQGFWITETECTQKQWMAVMGGNPSEFKGDDLPVEKVTWNDVQEFITKLNEAKTLPAGWKAALPTEAQWEYACRAGTKTTYSFGETLDAKQANFDKSLGKTSAVASYRRMRGDCMTCTATCGNGARIGMGRNSLAAPTRRGWLRARSGCSGAAVGTTKRAAAAPQPAATATRPPNTDSEGSVLLSVQSVRTADSGNFFSTPISPPSRSGLGGRSAAKPRHRF